MEEDEIAFDLVRDLGADYMEQLWLLRPLSFILRSPYEEATCQS